jgi:hypothetical protein
MWQYAKDGQSVGPLNEGEMANAIRTGVVTPETFVWQAGMQDWLPAGQSSLATFFITAIQPPPAPPAKEKKPSGKLNIVFMILGGVLGYAAMSLVSPQMKTLIFFGGVAGLICGLIPFFCGRNRNPKLAKTSLACCCIAGCAFGALLALPVAIIFTIVTFVKEPASS